MQRRPLILVAFLLVLFMIPMSFANVAAIAYESSSDSIPSFSETLPDNVLFSPDAIEPKITDGNVSGAETNFYNATFVNDATTWNNFAQNEDLYTYFDIDGSFPVDTMHLEIEATASGPIASHTLNLYLYNPHGSDLLVASKSEAGAGVDAVLNGWYNVTAWGYYEYDSKHTFYLFTTGSVNPTNILVDYFRLSFMTGASQANPVLSEPYFATGGDTGFGNTYVVDSDNFTVDGVLEFSYYASNISSLVSFTYAIYGVSDGTIFVHYSSDGVDYGSGPFDAITSEGWYNGTGTTALGSLENTGIGYVWFVTNSESTINYMELSFTYIPVSNYGEGFSDVSDWAGFDSTDGDIAYWDTAGDDSYKEVYTDVPSFVNCEGLYIEWRIKANVSTVNGRVIGYFDATLEGDDRVFQSSNNQEGAVSTSWQTFKYYLPNSEDFYDITKAFVRLRLFYRASSNARISLDYIRVGPSNEMGWQHDGSTILGVTTGYDISTDGDLMTFTNNVAGVHTWDIYIDATTTQSKIERDYYPMLEFKIDSVVDGDSDGFVWLLRSYSDSGTYDNLPPTVGSYTDATGIFRVNLAETVTALDPYRFRFYLQDENDSLTLDYIKMYSIANFSSYSAHASIDLDDVFFVDNGVLNIELDESAGVYIRLNYDPPMDVDYALYNIVNSTVYKDGSQADLVGYNWIDSGGFLQDNWTAELTQDLTGTPYLKIDMAGSWEIHDLMFLTVVPSWQIVSNIEVVFIVLGWHIISSIVIIFLTEISTWTLNLFLIFLGLAMLPISTVYLVHGGRSGMSMDKIFYGLVVFILGWAFFLGGIFV